MDSQSSYSIPTSDDRTSTRVSQSEAIGDVWTSHGDQGTARQSTYESFDDLVWLGVPNNDTAAPGLSPVSSTGVNGIYMQPTMSATEAVSLPTGMVYPFSDPSWNAFGPSNASVPMPEFGSSSLHGQYGTSIAGSSAFDAPVLSTAPSQVLFQSGSYTVPVSQGAGNSHGTSMRPILPRTDESATLPSRMAHAQRQRSLPEIEGHRLSQRTPSVSSLPARSEAMIRKASNSYQSAVQLYQAANPGQLLQMPSYTSGMDTPAGTLTVGPYALPGKPLRPDAGAVMDPSSALALPTSTDDSLPTGGLSYGPESGTQLLTPTSVPEEAPLGTGQPAHEAKPGKGKARANLPKERADLRRTNALYQATEPNPEDGLWHCPYEANGCPHKPVKLKCSYHKYLDSHLRPYVCKHAECSDQRFSSMACKLRHEREAHGSHGHGKKPFLCHYPGCDRSVPGNGFPRPYNLNDHMRRVHGWEDPNPKTKKHSGVDLTKVKSGRIAKPKESTSRTGHQEVQSGFQPVPQLDQVMHVPPGNAAHFGMPGDMPQYNDRGPFAPPDWSYPGN